MIIRLRFSQGCCCCKEEDEEDEDDKSFLFRVFMTRELVNRAATNSNNGNRTVAQ